MVIFFTIPVFFIVALIIIVLAVGVEALMFVQEHILVVSVILWLPMAWFVLNQWKDKTISDDEKVETALFPIFAIPAYAALIKLVGIVLNALSDDLFRLIISLVEAPLDFGLILTIGMGIAVGLEKINEKIIRSKFVTLFVGILIAGVMTVFVWNRL